MERPKFEDRIHQNNIQFSQNEEQIRRLTRENHWLKQENKLYEKRLEEAKESQPNSELLDDISKGLK